MDDKVRENRLRRVADRQGLKLTRSRRRDPRALDFESYWLTDLETGGVVMGAGPTGMPDATLDEVEEWLAAGDEEAATGDPFVDDLVASYRARINEHEERIALYESSGITGAVTSATGMKTPMPDLIGFERRQIAGLEQMIDQLRASAPKETFQVQRWPDGKWDGKGYQRVDAKSPLEAGELVVGEKLVEAGPTHKIRAQVRRLTHPSRAVVLYAR